MVLSSPLVSGSVSGVKLSLELRISGAGLLSYYLRFGGIVGLCVLVRYCVVVLCFGGGLATSLCFGSNVGFCFGGCGVVVWCCGDGLELLVSGDFCLVCFVSNLASGLCS